MVLLDLPQLGLNLSQLSVLLGLDLCQLRVQLVLQPGQVLDPTGAVLSQEDDLHLDSEVSLRREEISDNTSGVGDTLPASPTSLGRTPGIVDQSLFGSAAAEENFTLQTKLNTF